MARGKGGIMGNCDRLWCITWTEGHGGLRFDGESSKHSSGCRLLVEIFLIWQGEAVDLCRTGFSLKADVFPGESAVICSCS